MRAILRILALSAAIAVTVATGAGAQSRDLEREIRQNRDQLEALRRQAEEARHSAREAARHEKSVLSRLAKADEALRATRAYLHRLELGQRVVTEQMQETSLELTWAKDELAARRGELRRRLRYSYTHDRGQTLEIVFSSESLPMLLQRVAFMNRVLAQDRLLIEQVTAREAEVRETLQKLQEQKAEMDRLLDEKQREERQYSSLKEERARDLDQVRDEKSAHEAAAKELEQAAAQLERVLNDLDRKRQEALLRKDPALAELDLQDFGKNRGRLPWPVRGDVITKFGRQQHPKYKTEIVSNGLDIAAPAGTPVSAVGPGIVDLVQWLPGYGETVILNHGRGFYSIYGHLGSVSVRPDDRVDPGHVLGTVGETGSLKGVCLHFEIRSGGSAQDPLMWLR